MERVPVREEPKNDEKEIKQKEQHRQDYKELGREEPVSFSIFWGRNFPDIKFKHFSF